MGPITQPPTGSWIDIQFRKLYCLDYLASLLSCGCLPLMFWFYRRQLPIRLTDQGMVMRSGKVIPWTDFRSAKATDVYYGSTLLGTRYRLWYSAGKVEIDTDKVRNSQAVVQFLRAHLPEAVIDSGKRDWQTL